MVNVGYMHFSLDLLVDLVLFFVVRFRSTSSIGGRAMIVYYLVHLHFYIGSSAPLYSVHYFKGGGALKCHFQHFYNCTIK